MTLPSTPHLVHYSHSHFFAMPTPSIYLRTPDATPGSFVKLLWDFYLQYHECHPSTPVRVAQIEDHPIHLEILGSGAHPSRLPKPRPNGSPLRGQIHADSAYGHRSCCVRSARSSSIRGTLCQRARILLFSESCSTRRSCIFSRWTN